MRKLKILLMCLAFVVCVSVVSQANECRTVKVNDGNFMASMKNTDVKSFSPIGQKITNYAASNERKARGFRGMGAAGAVLFGLSWLFTLSGIALLIVYYLNFYGYLMTISAFSVMTSLTWLYMLYGGIALIAIGEVMFWPGLILMIVGFAIANHYENKTSLNYDPDLKAPVLRTSFSIKLGSL